MPATELLYATAAAGSGLLGQPSAWANLAAATGAPDGTSATNNNTYKPGYQRLLLSGYDPQAAILAATGGQVPYSLDYMHVQVKFSLDSATNYDPGIDVLLLAADGTPLATRPLYLDDATTGVTVVAAVNFTGHTGYADAQPLLWAELAGCKIALDVTRSGAAGADTLRIDAVGMFVSYTVDPPEDPGEPEPQGGGVTLRAYDRDGRRLGQVPWSSLQRTIVRNEAGALTTQLPKSLLDPALLGDEVYLRVAEDGVEAPDYYLIDDDGDNDADAGGTARPVAIGATGAAAILEWGTVYSWEYETDQAILAGRVAIAAAKEKNATRKLYDTERFLAYQIEHNASTAEIDAARATVTAAGNDLARARAELQEAAADEAAGPGNLLGLDPTYGFASATPGKILKTLIDLAKLRGCFPHLTYSFTEDVDSSGRGWTTEYARTYDVGTTIGKVLAAMAEDGWVDWEMAGFRLDLYMPDTVLATDYPETILRLGKQVTSGPRKRTRKGARSVILANGAEGAMIEVTDPEAVARLGRREGYEGRNGITDVGTLTAATQVSLKRATSASESITLEMAAAEAPPLPRPGCYIRYDQRRISATQLEPMRVQSIAWDYSQPGTLSVELADLWVDQDVRLARRVDAILNGSSANERVPVQNPADTVPPAQVQGLAVVSAPFQDPVTGQQFAQATASWQEVTRDEDGTSVDELAGYTIEWRQPEVIPGTKRVQAGAGQTLISWSPLVPATFVDARIAAYDRHGNYGAWSDWVTVPTGLDETPPPKPSTPVVEDRLSLLRVFWDGQFAYAFGRPPDLARIEVHVSDVDGFDPNADPEATRKGILSASSAAFIDAPYGAEQFVRLVAVDTSGNRSEPSDQASGFAEQVVSGDIFEGAVGSLQLAEAAVTTAKINDLAVNNAKIGGVEVGKLEAGVLSAEFTVSGRIATGERGFDVAVVELNSLGIYRWDADDNLTVALDDQGAMLTGLFRTALGGRRIELGANGNYGRIDFYAPNGNQGVIRSYTEASGTEAMQIGMQPYAFTGETLWNRLNINTSANGDYTTLRSGTLEFIYDIGGGIGGGSGRFMVFATQYRGVTGTTKQRFVIEDMGGGRVVINAGSTENSPLLNFIDDRGFGLAIRAVSTPGQPQRLEAVSFGSSSYQRWGASGYDVLSDANSKTAVRSIPRSVSLLDDVRRVRPKKYRRRDASGDGVHGPVEIGLLAQEAPEQIVAPGAEGAWGVDLYQMASMTWGGLGELADKVDELAAQVAVLTKGSKAK